LGHSYQDFVGGVVESVTADSCAAAALALPPKILNMTVPQVGHLPFMALRPFFIVSSTASMISFFALHLTQYPSGIENLAAMTLYAPRSNQDTLLAVTCQRQLEKGWFAGKSEALIAQIAVCKQFATVIPNQRS
jgi:hypothetical protein